MKTPRIKIKRRCETCGATFYYPQAHVTKTGHTDHRVEGWTEPQSYESAHHLVAVLRGKASDHSCVCGEPAINWALSKDLHVMREMRWSPNPDDYDALCARCHKLRDWSEEERRENALRARSIGGKRGAEALKRKRREDPALNTKIVNTLRENRMRAFGTKPPVPTLAEKRQDPAYEKKFRADKRKANLAAQRRWVCGECGLSSNATGLGRHQKKSGHSGRKEENREM